MPPRLRPKYLLDEIAKKLFHPKSFFHLTNNLIFLKRSAKTNSKSPSFPGCFHKISFWIFFASKNQGQIYSAHATICQKIPLEKIPLNGLIHNPTSIHPFHWFP